LMAFCYYVLDNHTPIPATSVLEWGAFLEKDENRIVALTGVCDDAHVSTVFVGLDHNFLGVGPPLLFESMIFGGAHDGEQRRYATWAEAEAGHAEFVALARMEWGLCRCRCEDFVRSLGLPIPRKSACVFCPYASKGDWQTLARELPERFAEVAELEASKPPTKGGKKLSIMGYRTLRDHDGTVTGYRAPPLPQFIEGTYRPRPNPCGVCGARQRATKATGCSYLEAA